jgi:hypothetical protein
VTYGNADFRRWWYSIPGDVRDVPAPPGACMERIHREGDPSTPCVLAADHQGACEDIEGYTEYN